MRLSGNRGEAATTDPVAGADDAAVAAKQEAKQEPKEEASEITKTKVALAKQDFKSGRIPQSELQNILASEKMLKCYLAYHQRLFFATFFVAKHAYVLRMPCPKYSGFQWFEIKFQ